MAAGTSASLAGFSSLPPNVQQQLLNGPALKPPVGKTSHLDNPPNLNILNNVLLAVFLLLITIGLAGRISIRAINKQLFVGDYMLIVAYVIITANLGLSLHIAAHPGSFVHQWDIRLKDLIPFLHFTFVSSIVYIFSITLLKVAILLEWIRIFVPLGTRNYTYWISHVLIWANTLFGLIMVINLNIACTPYEYSWNKLIPGNCHRVDTGLTNLSVSVFNLVTDILIFLIPQATIWNLHMTRKRKAGVAVLFALGLLGIAASAIRVAETVIRAGSSDFTYNFSSVAIASAGEITAAFLVICIPALPKAFDIPLTKLRSSLRSWRSREKLQRSSDQASDGHWSESKGSQSQINRQDNSTGLHSVFVQPGPSTDNFDKASVVENGGILRTTQFAMNERFDPEGSHIDFTRQHVLNGLKDT
ncbi:hypothetical protein F5Y17DRAFT_421194 [Xylariaceae sp. FL0594]|nr:hypothetical protein F5Y17DRAFT_421194 [Xylariaceae sp. FL0594]